MYYQNYREAVNQGLEQLTVSRKNGQQLCPETALDNWCEQTRLVKQTGKSVYFIGNGASAMMASHMAADACKKLFLKSIAFNDSAFLTAISNDVSFDQVFSLPLERFAQPGDMLISISSSGNSPNILAALTTAQKLQMISVTLSGMSPHNKSRNQGVLNFYIPADSYGLVEICHQTLLHCWLDKLADPPYSLSPA